MESLPSVFGQMQQMSVNVMKLRPVSSTRKLAGKMKQRRPLTDDFSLVRVPDLRGFLKPSSVSALLCEGKNHDFVPVCRSELRLLQ